MVLYKYRNFSNLEFALDIFVNKQLYASTYKNLNDPMEGSFVYSKRSINKLDVNRIIGSKNKYKILSLSSTPDNMLMWSYYCQGHSGFVVGIQPYYKDAEVKKIEYIDDFSLNSVRGDTAKYVLSRKLKLWEHEQEYRIFKKKNSFVKVRIKKLIFGINTSERQEKLLTQIAKKFCPSIRIKKLKRGNLNKGNANYYNL
jgi:hypothetical protein